MSESFNFSLKERIMVSRCKDFSYSSLNSSFSWASSPNPKGDVSMISLPQHTIDTRFSDVEQEVEKRWASLTKEMVFPPYQFHQDEAVIAKEFQQFNQIRYHLHVDAQKFPYQANPDFKLAQNIFIHHRYRQPNCITFEHSKADDSYNCTCLKIGEKKFFVLDGPTAENIEHFYRLLSNWGVTTLVCLTDAEENGVPKCFPYWKESTSEEAGNHFLNLPIEGQYESPIEQWEKKRIFFHHLPQWKDHSAVDDIKILFKEIQHVRSKHHLNNIVAIHCSGGVGRSGTFLAAICLLDEIDTQLKNGVQPKKIQLSIAELFLKLNFYRHLLVAKEPQYTLLFKIVDYYLEQGADNALRNNSLME